MPTSNYHNSLFLSLFLIYSIFVLNFFILTLLFELIFYTFLEFKAASEMGVIFHGDVISFFSCADTGLVCHAFIVALGIASTSSTAKACFSIFNIVSYAQ